MKTRRQRWIMSWLLLAVVMLMLPMGGALAQTNVTTSKPALGDGSRENPFIISSAKELAWFRDWVNGTYMPEEGESASRHGEACAKISDDVDEIDMSTVCGESIGSWVPIGSSYDTWSGCFDGNNKVISNLFLAGNAGLFGTIEGTQNNCIVKNLYFKNAIYSLEGYVPTDNEAPLYMGFLAGRASCSSIKNINILSGDIKISGLESGFVGCLIGEAKNNSIISSCTNYATATTENPNCGGLVGVLYSSKIEKCTNYGNITSSKDYIGGIAGYCRASTIHNCSNIGNIKGYNFIGGITGAAKDQTIIDNILAYGSANGKGFLDDKGGLSSNSGVICGDARDAIIRNNAVYNNLAMTSIAIGSPFGVKPSTIYEIYGYSFIGVVGEWGVAYITYLLQQAAGEEGVWGLTISKKDSTFPGMTYYHYGEYPIIGSPHTVYADNVTIYCNNTLSGNFTNEPISNNSLSFSHGTATYIPEKAHTCLAKGNIACYQCSYCKKYYSDEQFTQPIDNIYNDPTTGHEYKDDACTLCHKQIPILKVGTHQIQIEEVYTSGGSNLPGGYNLFKYVATCDDEISIYTSGDQNTDGSLWNSDLTRRLTYKWYGGEGSNFKFTYKVEKGKIYYIGVRESTGKAISSGYTLTIEGKNSVGTLGGKDIIGNKQGDTYIVEDLNIPDGQQFSTNTDNVHLQSGSYTRTFTNTKWQPLYVPFELEVNDELLADFDLAAPNNLHEYELSDGTTKVVLEAKKMKSGYTIKALRPYLIRAKEAGEKTILLANSPLKGSSEDTYVDCASVLRQYKLIGTLKGKTSFDPAADFVLSQGLFYAAEADTQLKAMRWYLNATDRDTDMGINAGNSGDEGETSASSRSIDISIIDGDATTGIEDIHVITEQADGSATSSRRGIFDLQGRKLIHEPKSGVYIKDGKKVVK